MTPELATAITGGLSHPSKMPGPAWNIPASLCLTGGKLRKVPGSTCSHCYALKGRYGFPNVQQALNRRLKAHDDPRWVEAMAYLIDPHRWFRWFDSGDLQSESMLIKVMDVCAATPRTRHWLPTREYGIVTSVLKIRKAPPNLNIRLSAHMVDHDPPKMLAKMLGVTTSGVGTGFYTCPAPSQNNQCADCRHCWDRRKKHVIYHKH